MAEANKISLSSRYFFFLLTCQEYYYYRIIEACTVAQFGSIPLGCKKKTTKIFYITFINVLGSSSTKKHSGEHNRLTKSL